ncbi:MAG: zinc ribbon domain-containing protein [Candidatus Viridilinea halotolerans]|uniref:Zinc ribbon domain-containing protein n=1 Tax=Candidatus Viridilinea halotolerans TaxID=2491704 RepID=A0A426U3P3_9CHLR|nr:MAG: zinc ribbon domain-containing protein [Candidatus Viridilinea halotolerans]
MVERICPECQHANPLENRFCGACGAALTHHALVPQRNDALVIAGQTIPMSQLQQVGKAVAVGLAAVAFEAGAAWLRRRSQQPLASQVSSALAANPAPTTETPTLTHLANTVTIVSQRVTEIWDEGRLTRQIVEKHVWRKEGS